MRNWVVTYAGNLIGSLLFVWAFQYTGTPPNPEPNLNPTLT